MSMHHSARSNTRGSVEDIGIVVFPHDAHTKERCGGELALRLADLRSSPDYSHASSRGAGDAGDGKEDDRRRVCRHLEDRRGSVTPPALADRAPQ